MTLRPFASALAFALALTPIAVRAADPTAPPTPVEVVTDTYHGVAVDDPYRWMEDMASPRWQQWVRAQADHANAVLARIPGRDALRARLVELADATPSVGRVRVANGRVFYLRGDAGRSVPRLYVRKGIDGTETLLFDPAALPANGRPQHIDFLSPSPDGRRVALGLSSGGTEASVLRVLDVDAKRLLPDAIDGAGLNDEIAWRPDSRSFFYNRLPPADASGAREKYNKSAVYLHVLGRDPGGDPAVIGWGASERRAFAVPDLPHVFTVPGSKWAFAVVQHGDAREVTVDVAPLAKVDGPATPWRTVARPEDGIVWADVAGDALFALSTKDAPRGRLLRFDLARPDAAPVVVVPEGRAVLREIAPARDAVYVRAIDGGASRLFRVSLDGRRVAEVALPYEGTVGAVTSSTADDGVLVRLEGWTRAPAIFRIAADGSVRDTKLQPPSPVDFSGVAADRVTVKSHDGVEVPLWIVARKDARRDGSHPAIVSGYGAYGIVQEPRYSASRLAWLERGGVFAVCGVRGGGEFGAQWHRAGRILEGTKQNTVSDFVACAEHLVALGWTTRAKLAGAGGSAGGITIGGAVVQRPDLFAAAHSAVGLSDMLRMEHTPNGAPNVAEFGTVANPDHFRGMLAISPYHNVKDGVAYPAVIVTTGANDPRVDAWLPGKFAARLQAATSSGKPVLLRVDFDAGHGRGSTREQFAALQADVWSFFLWQTGDPAFQPRR